MRTTSSWWLLSMAEVFRRQGLPVARLFSEAGLSLQSLAHQNTRYPQDGVTRLWDLAEQQSGNDQIGLDVGCQVSVTGFPVLAYSLITARGLVDGFQRFQRYQRMIGESANIRLAMGNGQVSLDFHFSGDEMPVSPHTIDAAMAAMVNMARLLEGKGNSWQPLAVQLRRRAPTDERFTGFFGCPVHFQSEKDSLILDPAVVAGIAEHEAAVADPEWETAVSNRSKPTAELVTMLVKSRLQDGAVSKQAIADHLNMTPRTLQRRLAKEGESYQGIVDGVRYQNALEALANPLLLPTEVAFLCGFSDLTAFHHAFRRWQGMTPGEYRAQLFAKDRSMENTDAAQTQQETSKRPRVK